jgi:hypothetical protein
MNKRTLIASATVTLLLAACGGGGGDEGPRADPQGFWSGPASTGYTVNAVILDTGEVWGVYSDNAVIWGALYGSASVSGQNITIRGTDFNFASNSASAGTLSGTVIPRSSMSLASSSGITASLTYGPSYDTPATAAAIEGNWSFQGRSGAFSLVPGTVTVNSSGSFILSQTGCTSTGSITPRAGGKNIYDLNMTSAGDECALGYSSLSGVVYLNTDVTPNRFLALGLTPSKNDGLIVLGTRENN